MSCIVNSQYVGKSRIGWLKYNPIFWAAIYLPYVARRNALKSVDKFIAISDFVKGILMKHGVPASKIAKIYNIAEIPNNNLEIKGLKLKNKKVISTIGTLDKIKGVDVALKAFSKIKGNAVLLIAGEGPEKSRLIALAEELKIKDKVIFLGKIDQRYIPFIYKNSDIILLPSLWPEPFSRVPMEAAFFKKPILASAIGGNLDLPDKFIFKNEKELAEKMLKIQTHQNFSIYKPESNLKKIIDLYLSVNR